MSELSGHKCCAVTLQLLEFWIWVWIRGCFLDHTANFICTLKNTVSKLASLICCAIMQEKFLKLPLALLAWLLWTNREKCYLYLTNVRPLSGYELTSTWHKLAVCSVLLLCCIWASHCEFSWISEHRRVWLSYFTVLILRTETEASCVNSTSPMRAMSVCVCPFLANGNLRHCQAQLTAGDTHTCVLGEMFVCLLIQSVSRWISLKPVEQELCLVSVCL